MGWIYNIRISWLMYSMNVERKREEEKGRARESRKNNLIQNTSFHTRVWKLPWFLTWVLCFQPLPINFPKGINWEPCKDMPPLGLWELWVKPCVRQRPWSGSSLKKLLVFEQQPQDLNTLLSVPLTFRNQSSLKAYYKLIHILQILLSLSGQSRRIHINVPILQIRRITNVKSLVQGHW